MNPFKSRNQTAKQGSMTNDKSSSTLKRTAKKNRALVVVVCALVIMFLAQNNRNNKNMRRILCERKLQKSFDSQNSDGSFLNNLMDRKLQSWTTSSIKVECETEFPDQVGDATASNYYADAIYSGTYYQKTAPVPPDSLSLMVSDHFDPTLLSPDTNNPHYNRVVMALLDLYTPKTYNPIDTTLRPEGTTAYVVMIYSCPEFYMPGQPDWTDPGTQLFEASAIIKQAVCKIAVDLAPVPDNATSQLRGLQEVTDADMMYTM